MYNLLIVGVGGFLGSVLRYALNSIVYETLAYPNFPYGTLIINVLGCFFIGLVASLAESRIAISPSLRIFIQIGLLGGFTTFSSFGYETFNLIRDGQFLLGAANILLQVVVGLAAVWLGYSLGQV